MAKRTGIALFNQITLVFQKPTFLLQLLGRPIFYFFLYLFYLLLFITAFLVKIPPQVKKQKLIWPTPEKLLLSFLTSRLQNLRRKSVNLVTKLIYMPKLTLPHLNPPQINFPKLKLVHSLWLINIFLIFTILVGLATYSFLLKDLPNPEYLSKRNQVVTTKILDRNGNLLYKIYRRQNRSLVSLDEVPTSLKQATLAIEDAEFYNHHGFSWRGITRSAYRNIFSGRLSGGSTITQQLVKNALLSPERTWQRKLKEIVLSLWVETHFTKDQIFQMYLNEVGYGGSAYGVEEAAQLYFGKSVKDLTLAESALLAGLAASPSAYSPFGAHPQMAKIRQEYVLDRMVEEKYLTLDEAERAKKQLLSWAPQKNDMKAPHFVMFVKELLVNKYGEQMVEEGGLEVRTSLDLDLQDKAEKIVAGEIKKVENLRITNGAALVTKPKTGEILAMVGSRDYFNITHQGNYNVTTALRQPGSSIKPVNYAVALTMGFTLSTIIPDTPIVYQVPGQPPYSPKNYDNRYHGNVTLRTALGSSYNIPAVKVLSSMGVNRMIDQGRKMGITTWNNPSNFGLSLTLGGGEVKMTELAVVYGTLANMGTRVDLNPILEVKDYKGRIFEKRDSGKWSMENAPEVLSPQIAYLLSDILSDNWARMPAFGANSQLVIPDKTVAVKTGTTNNLKDNWTIGYTPSYLVAAWVGNNDATPMSYVASGVTGASTIWNLLTKEVLAGEPDEHFTIPDGMIKVEICQATNTLSCDACPNKRWEIYIKGTEPAKTCNEEQIKAYEEEKKKEID